MMRASKFTVQKIMGIPISYIPFTTSSQVAHIVIPNTYITASFKQAAKLFKFGNLKTFLIWHSARAHELTVQIGGIRQHLKSFENI
jgi:hypothetical protein